VPGSPLLLMLHGWMDVSGTFQFLVESLQSDWHIIAPDWLGCGLSDWRRRPYWLADLMIDLDALVDCLSPQVPVRIVGHSMGGNIASLWAGARPERLERLVLVESFGAPRFTAVTARELHLAWLRDGRNPPREPTYAGLEAFAERLRQANPRLSGEQAERMCCWLARELDDGRIAVRVDPSHRNALGHYLRDEEYLSAWSSITAAVLWVTASESATLRLFIDEYGSELELKARLQHMRGLRHVEITDAGHNVHHDQPGSLARVIEPFLLEDFRN
jgi:pimeloyl-ACP methyl ester carboxylesterase